MKKIQHIEAIIPLINKGNLFNYPALQQDIALKELIEIFENELFDFGSLFSHKKINSALLNQSDLGEKLFYFIKNLDIIDDSILVLSFDIELFTRYNKVLKIDGHDIKNSDNRNISLIKSFIADDFMDLIYESFLHINIARPASLSAQKGVILIDEMRWEDTYEFTFPVWEAYDYKYGPKYPEIFFYETNKIRKGIKNLGISFYNETYSKLSIAINCLTYVLSPDLSDPERLVYTLIGIEALYTKSNTNITEQLNEKIQLYLGQLNDYKKIIKNMYEIRSRFLHGDLQIKPYFLYNNTSDQKVEDDIYDSLLVSTRILISTIQKMINENRTELEFKYALK